MAEDLAKAGTIDPWAEPVIQFQDLRFPTPSGKIEIASARAEADGHPRVPSPQVDGFAGSEQTPVPLSQTPASWH